jgi:hypothetical protein
MVFGVHVNDHVSSPTVYCEFIACSDDVVWQISDSDKFVVQVVLSNL